MKNRIKLVQLALSIAAITLFAVACDENENTPTPPEKTTTLSATEHTFEGLAGAQTFDIVIKADDNWTATLSSTTWLTATPISGKAGETTITVRPTRDNAGMQIRKATMKFFVDNDDKEYIATIRQRGAESIFTIDNTDLELTPNTTGRSFADTITINSNRKWSIVDAPSWLTFTFDKTPAEGATTEVMLIVKADFSKFPSLTPEGEFKIKVDEDDQTTIKVKATAACEVYTSEEMTTKVTSLEIVKDPANAGLYNVTAYFKANIEWNIAQIPNWMTVSTEKNVTASGDLTDNPTAVIFQIKKENVSIQELSGTVVIKDIRNATLHSIPVHFAGAGEDFLEIQINIPAQDKFGEDFMFDPLAGEGRVTELPFKVRTSRDYGTIEAAPFKIIALSSPSGIIERKVVKWAYLKMGDKALSSSNNGIFEKQIILCVNERNDEDDKNKVTTLGAEREANLFFVNQSITMNDLFADASSTTLKEEYQGTYIKQKNALIAYSMSVDGIISGNTLTVPAAGWDAKVYNIITDSPKFSASAVWDAPGQPYDKAPVPWVIIDYPKITVGEIIMNDPTKFILTVGDMEGSAFTTRRAKVSFKAYRGLDENGMADEYEMFTFYVNQSK